MKSALALLCCLLCCACRRGMVDQPRIKPLAESALFPDGAGARPLPEHTVARGHLDEDDAYFRGLQGDYLVTVLPTPLSRELLERGQQRFNIYCAVCHGPAGEGNGMIVQRGFPRPPSFHEERLRRAPIGHFFHVITWGYGVMYPYAARVPVPDRWAIAAYIRALQLSQHATWEDVPAVSRAELERSAL